MKADALLFVGILIFLFILWLYNGGPNNPISFSGPYITPVTNVGQSSNGYGSTNTSAGSAIWQSVTSSFGSNDNQHYYGQNSGTGNSSGFANSVSLSGGNVSSSDIHSEYVTIRSSGNSPIDISGWRLVSEKSGTSATIGQGVVIAKKTDNVDIMLKSGDEAIVVTGRSPISRSFLETSCTGYLQGDNEKFTPALSSSRCPAPLDELDDYYGGTTASAYDKCAKYVSSLSYCRVPDIDTRDGASNSCQNFIEHDLTYDGCVQNHRDDATFQGSTWRVYLSQTHELWRSSNDIIDLLDRNGNRVAQYSY